MDDAPSAGAPLSEELAAGLAHEIRNQLHSLHIHLGILERELAEVTGDERSRIATELAAITRSLSAIEDFLADFLLYARPQELRCMPADLRALVRELVAFLAPEAAARGVALMAELDDAPEQAAFDSAQMKRALLNIVLNGLEATPHGGRVDLIASTSPGAWTLAVRDSGAGLPPHVRERLFSPFVSAGGGAGLGLAIARQIISAHGGVIEVRSAARRGTELRLTLPSAPTNHG